LRWLATVTRRFRGSVGEEREEEERGEERGEEDTHTLECALVELTAALLADRSPHNSVPMPGGVGSSGHSPPGGGASSASRSATVGVSSSVDHSADASEADETGEEGRDGEEAGEAEGRRVTERSAPESTPPTLRDLRSDNDGEESNPPAGEVDVYVGEVEDVGVETLCSVAPLLGISGERPRADGRGMVFDFLFVHLLVEEDVVAFLAEEEEEEFLLVEEEEFLLVEEDAVALTTLLNREESGRAPVVQTARIFLRRSPGHKIYMHGGKRKRRRRRRRWWWWEEEGGRGDGYAKESKPTTPDRPIRCATAQEQETHTYTHTHTHTTQ
jgi:hypothetical protein